jgi:phosphoribosylaminoimidazolecarboxamide formyltransferase/IMP cyclohydrolase
LTKEFDKPTCVIVKHASPCGVATADSDDQAFKRALECDSVSAYGGILAFNTTLSKKAAHEISEFVFFEAVIAPSFQEGAVKILTERPKWGKKVRILCAGEDRRSGSSMSIRGVRDGVLIQDDDSVLSERFESVTVGVSPALEEELMFAWKVVKHVKSNAVVITKNFQTVGIGGGQVSRVDAAVMAVQKAGERAHGAVAASDALIPFKDTLKALIDAGVIAVVQPGGALRDEEVIALAMEHEIPMIFTGTRHFKH